MNAANPLRAALLTPPGRGAVAVVALHGDGAAAIVGMHFTSPSGTTPTFELNRIRFGRWRSNVENSAEQGEELVVCRRGDEQFEIHCHGGDAASAAILSALQRGGCAIVPWQQWHDDADPITAEVRIALAAARTTRIASILLDQPEALQSAFDRVRQLVEHGHRGTALEFVEQLLGRAALGRKLTEPFHVVLTGRPNVGKSSLLNALLGYRRAIVFDQPGTTRDVVTAATVVDGWPIELSDTAGLRTTGDELETAGVAAARRRLTEADLVVAVYDLTEPWTAEEAAILTAHPQAIVVLNKADATEMSDASRPAGLRTSATTGLGIEELLATIATKLVPNPPQPGEAVPFTPRQIAELEKLRNVILPHPRRGEGFASQ